jgi:CubicO group peptidase (beta-lactamase class C family)
MAGVPPFPVSALVTLANWQDPPFNRWAFQHIRELIPTARISRGDGKPSRLPRAERDISGLTFRSGDSELTVAQMLNQTYTDGFLVLHRGKVITEQYFNGLRPDTPHLLMSVSKSVVSTVAGILAGQGWLDVAAPVERLVPELASTSFAGATVQHLLDMRAGTHFDETYDNPESDVRLYERVYLWRPDGTEPRPADALEYYATLPNDGEHGGPFRYRSILTDVLGWVLEKVGGARLHELIAGLIWQPMGAEFDAEITVDACGNAMADGGICATLRDLGRFGLLFAQGGRPRVVRPRVGQPRVGRPGGGQPDAGRPGGGHTRSGRQPELVPAAWIHDTIAGAPDGPQAFVAAGDAPGQPPGAHYRNCWWVREPAVPFLHASGINGQNVFVHVPSQTVVVKFSTWPTALSSKIQMTTDAAKAIAQALHEGSA